MPGWHRLTRNLFDSVTTADITLASGAESPYGLPAAKYATYAHGKASVVATQSGRKGLKCATTAKAGSMPLWGQETANLRCYASIFIPSGIASNAGPIRAGVTVLANDGSSGSQYHVFCGLTISPGYSDPAWALALVNGATVVKTYASTAAAAFGTSTVLARPFIVETDGTVVTMTTPDGILTTDISADRSRLGSWYGARFITPGGDVTTATAVLEAQDWQFYDTAYTPVNDAYDRTKLLPDVAPLLQFGPSSEYLITSGKPTYDPDDVIYGAQSLVLAGNPLDARMEWTPPAPIDFSGKGLCFVARITAPDQLIYANATLAGPVTLPQATIPLVSASALKFRPPGSDGKGPGSVDGGTFDIGTQVVHFTGISGNSLTGCTGGTGTFPKGAVISQHNGQSTTPYVCTISLAASAEEWGAGNYTALQPELIGAGNWFTSTFLVDGPLGPEGGKFGTGAPMNAVGYIRIEFSGSKLPYTAAPYKGLQSRLTPQIKFDSLLSFSAVRAPTVTFTFDDSHASDFDVAIGCLERPRPGFPDGMRGTFHVIASNIGEPGECTLAELQKMSASGHEVCLHIYRKVHHAAPNVGGDGPLAHYVLVDPGGDSADIASEIAWLGAAGLPGPFADAYPAGQVAPDTVAAGVSHGLTALRTTSDGGGIPIISGSGATATCTGFDLSHLTERFMTNPPGAPWRVPGVGWLRDAVNRSKDLRGFTITIRLIYEAAVQGAKCVTYTHEMYGPGVVPPDGGSWNADMFNTVLDYVSDLVVGGNTSGFNAAGDHFPDLRVQTLTQAVAGVTPGAAVPEAFGVAV